LTLEKTGQIPYTKSMNTNTESSRGRIFAARLEHMMQVRGYSGVELSRLSGVSESALSNLLSGRRNVPRADTLNKIAAALEVSDGYLIGSTNDPTPQTGGTFPEYGEEVLEQMRRLGAAQNYTLLSIARTFVEETGAIKRLQMLELIQNLADARGLGAELDRVAELLLALETVPPERRRSVQGPAE